MADPLSAAASIVGIAVPVLHGTRLLLDDLEKLSDAPKTVESLKREICSVETTIQSLSAITEPQWAALGPNVIDSSKTTLATCKNSCEKFRVDLLGWTRHSSDGKLSWQDRARVGFFKQNRVAAMSAQLHRCQGSLNLVVSTATLHYSIINAQITQDIKASISGKTADIARSITSADLDLATVNTQQAGLDESNSSGSRSDTDTEYNILEQERGVLKSCLELLEALKSRNEEERERITQRERTTITFGGNNSGLQQGINYGSLSGFSFGGRAN